jgi:gas vesicle protein
MKSATTLVVGAMIGAGLAMLFAPRITKIGGSLENKVTDSIERGQAKVREITSQATRVADQAKDRVQRVQDAVDVGVRAFKEVKKKLA